MSLPEVLLWRELQQASVKFRRQHPLGPYVLDFYCPTAKLAVGLARRPAVTLRRVGSLDSTAVREFLAAGRPQPRSTVTDGSGSEADEHPMSTQR